MSGTYPRTSPPDGPRLEALRGEIAKLTPAQIDTTAKQFIDPDKMAKVRAGDLSKQDK